MKTRNIEQSVTINAQPAKVYEALMDSKKHAEFTGEPAEIDPRPGGAFKCYRQYINGLTLEFEPGKRIVQAWRSENWREGTNSIVTFRFCENAGRDTLLQFLQIGVPAGDHSKKSKGWRTHYWEPLKRFLESKKASSASCSCRVA